jgi:hypothetical protein
MAAIYYQPQKTASLEQAEMAGKFVVSGIFKHEDTKPRRSQSSVLYASWLRVFVVTMPFSGRIIIPIEKEMGEWAP